MRAADKYRQCWPDTVATIEKPPGAMVQVLATVATVAIVYFLTFFAFSL